MRPILTLNCCNIILLMPLFTLTFFIRFLYGYSRVIALKNIFFSFVKPYTGYINSYYYSKKALLKSLFALKLFTVFYKFYNFIKNRIFFYIDNIVIACCKKNLFIACKKIKAFKKNIPYQKEKTFNNSLIERLFITDLPG